MELIKFIWVFLSYFGDVAYWLGFTIAFFIIYPFLDVKNKKKYAWILYYLLPSILLSYISSYLLKLIFKIPRICTGLEYCPTSYAFPSTHATIMFALSMIVFLCFNKKPRIYIPLFLLAILTSYSRIALNLHTFFDIIGGAFLGIFVSSFWYILYKKVDFERGTNHFYTRKLIHLLGATIIILRLFVEQIYISLLLSFLTLTFLISEILRIKGFYFPIFQEISNF